MSDRRKDLSTDLGLLGLTVIWGVNFSVVKVALEEIEPLAFNALRFPLASLALWLVLRATPGRSRPDREDLPRILALGLLGHVLYQLLFIFGIDLTLAGNASLLLATTPVWTLILSAIAGHERPTPFVVAGIVGTLGGITLLVAGGGGAIEIGGDQVRGDALMLLAAVLWSFYTVGGRRPTLKYGSLRVTAWTLWVATPILVLLGTPQLGVADLGSVTPLVWGGVAYAGVFSVALAYLLWYRGVQRLGNSRTAVYSNLVPVVALVVAWAWLGEIPGTAQLLGAAAVLAGVTATRLGSPSSDPQSPERKPLRWRISGNS